MLFFSFFRLAESGTSCDAMESVTNSSSESEAICMAGECCGEHERERRSERRDEQCEYDEAMHATEWRGASGGAASKTESTRWSGVQRWSGVERGFKTWRTDTRAAENRGICRCALL